MFFYVIHWTRYTLVRTVVKLPGISLLSQCNDINIFISLNNVLQTLILSTFKSKAIAAFGKIKVEPFCLHWSCFPLQHEQSKGSNSNAGKMDQTWSNTIPRIHRTQNVISFPQIVHLLGYNFISFWIKSSIQVHRNCPKIGSEYGLLHGNLLKLFENKQP